MSCLEWVVIGFLSMGHDASKDQGLGYNKCSYILMFNESYSHIINPLLKVMQLRNLHIISVDS